MGYRFVVVYVGVPHARPGRTPFLCQEILMQFFPGCFRLCIFGRKILRVVGLWSAVGEKHIVRSLFLDLLRHLF